MTITTIDGIIAGMLPPQNFFKVSGTMEAVGVLHSLAYGTGLPGAAVAPSPGLNGAALTTYAGQIPWTNPTGGKLSYLSGFDTTAVLSGTLFLIDRLWHNSGFTITTTTAQTLTSATWPARDRNGSTNGEGIMVGIEVSTATTNAGAVANTTLSYTNSSNTSGQTATMASFPATAVAGAFVPFQLAAGDIGVRSIQSLTLGTSYAAGTIHLVAYRVLAKVNVASANIGSAVDAISGGFPQLYDDTVPFLLWLPTATTTNNI